MCDRLRRRRGRPMPYGGEPLHTEARMSIAVRYHPRNLTVEQYEEVVRREEATGGEVPTRGQGAPRLLRSGRRSSRQRNLGFRRAPAGIWRSLDADPR